MEMHTFAPTQHQAQPSSAANKIRTLAPPRRQRTNAHELEVSAEQEATTCFGHDFSRMSVFAPPVRLQAKLTVNTPGDSYEQEADQVADQVMQTSAPRLQHASCACGGACPKCQTEQPGRKHERIQTKRVGSSDIGQTAAPPIVHEVLRSSGQPLDAQTRDFMELRFGHDFSSVRIHADDQSAAAARSLSARAFTVGRNIMFGAREYQPETTTGRQLLAHELTHVVQQAATAAQIQRAPAISILDASSKEKETATQKKAAASCPIKCGGSQVGTLHAMPLFHHIYDIDPEKSKIVKQGDSDFEKATGIGSALHFVTSKKDAGCGCTDFKIIQVVESTHQGGEPRGHSIVDINPKEVADFKKQHPNDPITPYYGDWARNRHGRAANEIPKGYPDAGATVKSDHSIYDRPSRNPDTDLKDHADLSWEAEARVACLRKGKPDIILGGVIYGFSREFDSGYKPIQPEPPRCVAEPTKHFTDTLSKDPLVKGYGFEVDKQPDKKP
jgi:Domain of unknown function (DUF4157)